MKKINIKATIFLSAIVLVVVVLLLNLIEFRKTVDFTVPGIQMPKENAFGKQEEVQVSVNGTYYYRVLPWIHGSTFHGQISFAGEGEEPQNYFFTYGATDLLRALLRQKSRAECCLCFILQHSRIPYIRYGIGFFRCCRRI